MKALGLLPLCLLLLLIPDSLDQIDDLILHNCVQTTYFCSITICLSCLTLHISWPSGVIKWVCSPIHTHANPWGRTRGHLQLPSWQPSLRLAWCLIWWFTVTARNSLVTHGTKWPYWNQVFLNNIKLNHVSYLCIQTSVSDFWCPGSNWLLHSSQWYREDTFAPGWHGPA